MNPRLSIIKQTTKQVQAMAEARRLEREQEAQEREIQDLAIRLQLNEELRQSMQGPLPEMRYGSAELTAKAETVIPGLALQTEVPLLIEMGMVSNNSEVEMVISCYKEDECFYTMIVSPFATVALPPFMLMPGQHAYLTAYTTDPALVTGWLKGRPFTTT